jgi:hypothetical protein
MSAYSINSVRDPIHVMSFDSSFDIDRDALIVMADVRQLLDTVTHPIAVIYDMRQMHLSIGDLLDIPNFINRSGSGLSDHPLLAKMVFVTTSDLLRLASGPFVSGQLVNSMESAVYHARIAVESSQAA